MQDLQTLSIERVLIPELEISQSPKEYYFEYIQSFSSLPKNLQHSLLEEIYEISATQFTDYTFELFCEKEFYDSKSFISVLALVRESKSNKMIGFDIEHLYERYAFEGDYKETNKYFCISGLAALAPKYQGKKILKELVYSFAYLLLKDFPNSNLIVVDFYTNPIAYYFVQKESKLTIPSHGQSYSKKIEDFIIRTANYIGYKSLPFRHPLIVEEDHLIKGIDKQFYKENYENLPQEMKFFIDTTGLEPHAALACLIATQTLKDNSLGLEEISYEKPKNLNVKVYKWILNDVGPKI
ncbi:hypothetical protein SteCoe_15670 [Stentor coeruleus]|uniref:Uncharacterized protein n=1 Tax=Stentor coeruleus TaxID=5963 RepID=A0A1R2C300_9CILI|nr:hypothetical protein SteCoe_15670 [Stentor coeruleus]